MSKSPKAWLHEQLLSAPNEWFAHSPEELDSLSDWNKPNLLTAENLAEWSAFLQPFKPHAQVQKQLEKLRKPNALCVVAGQQAGLLGGPLYTAYKALSALQWAKKLEAKLKRPVVPIFWVASDDHDFAEIAPLNWLGGERTVQRLAINQRDSERGFSVYDSTLKPDDWAGLFRTIKESGLEFASLSEEQESFSFEEPRTIEDQFVHFFLRWFGELGIVPLVPRLPLMRKGAATLYTTELEQKNTSTELLISAETKLHELGLSDAGIHRNGGELNFFWNRAEGRCRLEWQHPQNDSRTLAAFSPMSGNSVWQGTAADVANRLQTHPEEFSPNAALRPLVQDLVLPTIAFIGGPSELVYHGQLAALYPLFNVTRPVCVPRASLTLLPKPLGRYLRKFGIPHEDLLSQSIEQLEKRLAERAAPGLFETIDARFAEMDETLKQIETDLMRANDPRLIDQTKKIFQYLQTGRLKIARRATQTLSARAESDSLHWAQVKETVFPGGEPQERVLNCFPFLHQELGGDAVARLAAFVDATQWKSHLVVDLNEVPTVEPFRATSTPVVTK